jgi:hypothetical protein
MLFFNRLPDDEEPHTITSKSLGQGKGRIETFYYGEAMPPMPQITNMDMLRVTRVSEPHQKRTFKQWLVSLIK